MMIRAALMLGLSTLALTGTAIGLTQAASAGAARATEQAATAAAKARVALAKRQAGKAIGLAEAAVGLVPHDAGYRALLGEAYLADGRFASARTSLEEALSLAPADPHVALNLALAQTATGDWAAARATLEAHVETIAPSDFGLAVALAGDPGRAVDLLTIVARSPQGDAKARQNLALSLALAGRWPEARAMAALDVAPGDLDRRITDWAALARPHAAADQVAALLGVEPSRDPGRPVALALVAQVPQVATAAAVDQFMPGVPAAAQAAPAPLPAAEAEPAQVADAAPAPTLTARPVFASITFAPPHEVVQALPAVSRAPAPVAVAGRPVRVAGHGAYFVQLGAYQNSRSARVAWRRMIAHTPVLAGQSPSGMRFAARRTSFYRLSVGGFARAEAVTMCGQVRAAGGRCFVRAGAGDQIASWHSRVQVASL